MTSERPGAETTAVGGLGVRPERFIQRAELLPAFLRRFVRSREIGLTLFAAVIGVLAAGFVATMSAVAAGAHAALFDLRAGDRLSAIARFDHPLVLLWPMIGGGVLFAMSWFWQRIGRGEVVDPIEANALHGGAMSFRDSALLALQTLVSNGFGASVGLEAGYTQIASGAASRLGSFMRLRREDMRTIVGSGAAGAIAAAFNGPFTGAFYAFELVMGQYAIGYVAPVMAASIAATLAMRELGGAPFALSLSTQHNVSAWEFPLFMLLGAVCAGLGILWMRTLPLIDRLFAASRTPRMMHPIFGGVAVGAIAVISPQILSGGHGALELSFSTLSLKVVLALAVLKMIAAAISLGAGFRGGLFFSSLLVGALLGRAVALALAAAWPETAPDVTAFALVGMGALAAAVIGAPLTMSFLVLETTSDYTLTGAVLAASVTSNLLVRETFGYSFSTWRFHLRGETIRSAQDVGWVRALTVGRLMRTEPATASAGLTIGQFQGQFALGARQRVALVDDQGRFAGLVIVADAYAEDLDQQASIGALARNAHDALLPHMSIKDAMRVFDETESDTLAVLDNLEQRRLVGTLKESYATRRYAEEMEKAQSIRL